MIWIKGSRSVMASKLLITNDKQQTTKDWILAKNDVSIPLVVTDSKIDIIPVSRIEKIRVKFYDKEDIV
jgi:hypothetical protein